MRLVASCASCNKPASINASSAEGGAVTLCERSPQPRQIQTKERAMALSAHGFILTTLVIIAIIAPHFTAVPPTAEKSINKDRTNRQAAIKAGKQVPTTPKWGFFGTIFHLILEQINDTKSAYNQISDLVNNQFSDDNAVTKAPNTNSNETTESTKISRAEFLKILDRNLKGLARLRNLENRIAKQDTMANLRRYKDEIFGRKNKNNRK